MELTGLALGTLHSNLHDVFLRTSQYFVEQAFRIQFPELSPFPWAPLEKIIIAIVNHNYFFVNINHAYTFVASSSPPPPPRSPYVLASCFVANTCNFLSFALSSTAKTSIQLRLTPTQIYCIFA